MSIESAIEAILAEPHPGFLWAGADLRQPADSVVRLTKKNGAANRRGGSTVSEIGGASRALEA